MVVGQRDAVAAAVLQGGAARRRRAHHDEDAAAAQAARVQVHKILSAVAIWIRAIALFSPPDTDATEQDDADATEDAAEGEEEDDVEEDAAPSDVPPVNKRKGGAVYWPTGKYGKRPMRWHAKTGTLVPLCIPCLTLRGKPTTANYPSDDGMPKQRCGAHKPLGVMQNRCDECREKDTHWQKGCARQLCATCRSK